MSAPANTLRGEADVCIGGVDLTIAIEFGGLARLSKAIGARSMEEIYQRLLGFEPFAVAVALQCLTVHPEGVDKAKELADKASSKITAADEAEWRDKIGAAFAAHVDMGRALRGEPSLSEQAMAALHTVADGAIKKKT